MKSMTGYGYSEYSCEGYIMTMELKSYNNRYLEVNYAAPSYLSPYEVEITDLIKKTAQRGHVDLSIKVKNLKGNVEVAVDEAAAVAYMDAFKKLEKIATVDGFRFHSPRISAMAEMDGVLTLVRENGIEAYRKGLDSCSKDVLSQFSKSKVREGEATFKDLSSKIEGIEKSLGKVEAKSGTLEDTIKTNLKTRINEMVGDQNYDENRILTEVAIMVMRYTINEEIERLKTHISEFKKLLSLDEPVGKKMDFLCQEMNREINTIGSKSTMVEINLEVVNMKDCLENIREQIRNIE